MSTTILRVDLHDSFLDITDNLGRLEITMNAPTIHVDWDPDNESGRALLSDMFRNGKGDTDGACLVLFNQFDQVYAAIGLAKKPSNEPLYTLTYREIDDPDNPFQIDLTSDQTETLTTTFDRYTNRSSLN